MNKIILVGRLARDPEVHQKGETKVAKYTIAVDRKVKKDGGPTADFINCTAFGGSANFAEQYFRKGMRISLCGRLQTDSYTNKDGVKVHTTEVIVEEHEFAQSKSEGNAAPAAAPAAHAPQDDAGDGFMNIPDGIDEELPFN